MADPIFPQKSPEELQAERRANAEEQAEADLANGIEPQEEIQDEAPALAPVLPGEPSTAKRSKIEEREDWLEDLATRRRERILAEINTVDVDNDGAVESNEEEQDTLQDTERATAPAPVTETQTELPFGIYVTDQGEQRVRSLVNGQVLDQSVQELQQAVLRQAPVVQQQPTNPQPAPADAVGVDLKALQKERRDAYARMYNGDETAIDDLTALDEKIYEATIAAASKTVNVPAALAEHQRQQNFSKWQASIGPDEATFLADTNYADLAKNPALYDLVVKEAVSIMKETKADLNGTRPLDVMVAAANKIRAAIGTAGGQQAQTVDPRVQRKQDLGNTAVTAGAAATTSVRRPATPTVVPDGGISPQNRRAAALRELRQNKGEKD